MDASGTVIPIVLLYISTKAIGSVGKRISPRMSTGIPVNLKNRLPLMESHHRHRDPISARFEWLVFNTLVCAGVPVQLLGGE